MRAIGIICEYNPFHNGHLYHLKKVREMFPNDTLILIMNSTFMQRGEASLITKWDKTKIALSYNIDIVIELPFVFGVQSADIFAKGAIYLLNEMNVSHIVFGSEKNDTKVLGEIANIQNTSIYNEKVKEYMQKGNNYPKALSLALSHVKKEKINKPNDLLALSYIKAIKELKSNIIPISIKRTNNYHTLSKEQNKTSATSIRNLIREKKDISSYIPKNVKEKINTNFFIENYFPFLKYKILTEKENLNQYQSVEEGLSFRIQKYITESTSLNQLIALVKTKRYTYNRITRMFTHILCNFTKEEASLFTYPSYIRILGFSDRGKKYLKERKGKTNIPILTKYEKKYKMLQIEKRVTEVYASTLKEEQKKELIKQEYKQSVIKYK